MDSMTEWLKNVDPIAVWGALLSTFLAIREYLKSKLKIEVDFLSTTSTSIGNKVTIRNNSFRPIVITYWEIVFRELRFLPLGESPCHSPESFTDFRISEHSSTTLEFTDGNYFPCSPQALKGRKLYMRLHVSGRRCPFIFFLYS
jgi:hypothetical protein